MNKEYYEKVPVPEKIGNRGHKWGVFFFPPNSRKFQYIVASHKVNS